MLSRQLSQASSWRRGSICLFCAARSHLPTPQLRPFAATTSALLKAPPNSIRAQKARKRIQKIKEGELAKSSAEAEAKDKVEVTQDDQTAHGDAARTKKKAARKTKGSVPKAKAKLKAKDKPNAEDKEAAKGGTKTAREPSERSPSIRKIATRGPKNQENVEEPGVEQDAIERAISKQDALARAIAEHDALINDLVAQGAARKHASKEIAFEKVSREKDAVKKVLTSARDPVRRILTDRDAVGKALEKKAVGKVSKKIDPAEGAPMSLKEALLAADDGKPREPLDISVMFPENLEFTPVEVDKPPVPMLSYGLDRVLFNQGVYRLQDPRSRIYNFDPYLEKIMPVSEFDFDALSEYKTSSKDEDLLRITQETGAKFTGSTSSMSSILQHFHYTLSNFRGLNHEMLSRDFPKPSDKFSRITLGPSAVFLRYKNGVYAIDADKSYDRPNIMSWLGHSLEKLLTTERSEFERYRKSNPEKVPAEDKSSRCYHYSRQGNLLMRSQLDAYDPRLPGTGVFDLKTRAVVSIRMNHKKYEEGSGYQLRHALGQWESFEREFYDMTRATLLKYSLQVRMGRMDGIFIAFHNIERIFGFQYLSLADMDEVLHGQRDTHLGDQEFKLSIGLVDEILSKATAQFPNTSLRLHIEARQAKTPFMYVFAEPVTDEQADEIQNAGDAAQKEFARTVIGLGKNDPKVQAEWQKTQDEVDEQLIKDQDGSAMMKGATTETETEVEQEEAEINYEKDIADAVREEGVEFDVEAEAEAEAEAEIEPEAEPDVESEVESEVDSTNTDPSTAEGEATSSGPLMGWTLTVRSKVNQGYVDRPVKLDKHDDWNIEYNIKEIPEDTRWTLYNAVKERRRILIGQDEEEADKGLKTYRDLIQRFSDRGREWRKKQDMINEKLGVKVFKPLGPGSDSGEYVDGQWVLGAAHAAEFDVGGSTPKETGAAKAESGEESAVDAKAGESKAADLMSKEAKEEALEDIPSVPS